MSALCDLPPLEPDADQYLNSGRRGNGDAALGMADIMDTSLSGRRVIRELSATDERRELPCMLVSDNAAELTSHAVLA